MKIVMSLFAILISSAAFAVDLPYSHLVYGSYSNLKDPTFVRINHIQEVTNYWDAVRYSYVSSANCVEELHVEDGLLVTSHDWVEKNHQVVQFGFGYIYLPKEDANNEQKQSRIKYICDSVSDFIRDMDGCGVIASTKNITYRGDSAKRCLDLYYRWRNTLTDPSAMPYFGLEWRTRDGAYALVYVAPSGALGGALTVSHKFSDIRIDFKGFKRTDTLRDSMKTM